MDFLLTVAASAIGVVVAFGLGFTIDYLIYTRSWNKCNKVTKQRQSDLDLGTGLTETTVLRRNKDGKATKTKVRRSPKH